MMSVTGMLVSEQWMLILREQPVIEMDVSDRLVLLARDVRLIRRLFLELEHLLLSEDQALLAVETMHFLLRIHGKLADA